ncbi:AraC family transcriptional regulator [Streptomyces kanamyceticus]|uniref:AraC family transcriptional regulator n=1 Tax=Streptomyces kanamyceticus TaxID=1967 RepID=A0A5J6GKF6_STRKN|nr:AraC family transcriptional regulator [Streptomyces kanamyceticus]QEU93606.1 AraC family transcriptional regulator [Streptomyces kanamyceticus]
MDVVSDVISAVRAGRPVSHRVRVSGSWCSRIPSYDGVGFRVVLEGSCWVLPDDGSAPFTLAAGDVLLLPRGAGHIVADSPVDGPTVERATPFDEWLETHGLPLTRDAPLTHDARQPHGPGPAGPGASGSAGPGPSEPAGPALEMLCGKYQSSGAHAHPLLAEIPDIVHLPRRAGRHPELAAAIDLLGREAGASRPGADVVVPGLLDLLLVYMVRAWLADSAADSQCPARWPAALNDPVVAKALRLLHDSPETPWSNEELASRTGVSRATLARRFTSLVGRAPMAYLTWWRMSRAATLLRSTPASLDTVARQVGYSSPYALSHAFTRTFGTTPGRYRTRLARKEVMPSATTALPSGVRSVSTADSTAEENK